MDVTARATLIQERTDELLVTVGRCARLDTEARDLLMAATSATLAANPLAAAVVAGPLVGLLYTALVELAKATGRTVDEVVAEYRQASVAAMEQARRVLGESTSP
jgi:hypothetical protein